MSENKAPQQSIVRKIYVNVSFWPRWIYDWAADRLGVAHPVDPDHAPSSFPDLPVRRQQSHG